MSRILNEVYKSATRLHDAGYLDGVTMRLFDVLCLSASNPVRLAKSAGPVEPVRRPSSRK